MVTIIGTYGTKILNKNRYLIYAKYQWTQYRKGTNTVTSERREDGEYISQRYTRRYMSVATGRHPSLCKYVWVSVCVVTVELSLNNSVLNNLSIEI